MIGFWEEDLGKWGDSEILVGIVGGRPEGRG